MQNYRLLHMIKGLDFGGLDGGAELFGATLAKELSKQYPVDLCIFWQRNTSTEKEWIQKLQDSDMNIYFASAWVRKYHLSSYLAAFRNIMQRYPRHSLAIAHSHFQLGTIAGMLLKVLGRAQKTVRTVQIAKEWGTAWADDLYRLVLTNWVFPAFFDMEVGVSQTIVDMLRQKPATRIFRRQPVFIPNAILQNSAAAPASSRDWLERLPAGRRIIGCVGRLADQKDYYTLLEAFARISPTYPDLYLAIVGDGELRAALERQARERKIDARVLFLGTRPDATAIMREFEYFVLASKQEGLPIVVLESMAASTPVITTAIPGTAELIENNVTGWLVPPQDPEALARAIQFALDNPAEGQRLAQAAREKVERFSLPTIASEYCKMYQSLLESLEHTDGP